uniref:Immunoglobulin V-set domain-containing protein n=1 Tax=Pelodiscus sinensis TaxID=13735 RepID=K7G502_PELSI
TVNLCLLLWLSRKATTAILSFAGCWALTGPEEASGPLGGSLSVQCQYKERYQKYKKYWCRGIFLFSCSIVIQTEGSEEKLAGNRVSIHDNHTQSTFTVTMESLAWNDTDTYWCGIDRPGFDSMINVNVLVFSGKSFNSQTLRPATQKS